MRNEKMKEDMEAIAMKFLSINENAKLHHQDSISTLKDQEMFGKTTATTTHSRTRSRVLSIISNNIVIAEYNFAFLNNKKELFKIPCKVIDDNDDDVLLEEDSNNCNISINENKAELNESDDDDFTEESLNEESYEINYEAVYRLISEFYSLLMPKFTSIDDFFNAMEFNIQKIDKWINRSDPFSHLTKTIPEFYKQSLYEMIFIGYVIFFHQMTINSSNDIHSSIAKEDFEALFQLLSECLDKLYENLMLIISFNSSNKPLSHIISFEELCQQYVKKYYQTNFKPSREQIVFKIKDNLNEVKESLSNITEVIINSIYQSVNKACLSSFSPDFIEEINYFEKLILILKKNNQIALNEFKTCIVDQYKKCLIVIQQDAIPIPYLPPIDSKRHKYTLVLDLDETLVHYVEEDEKAFVQVRPHAEAFITEMGKYFELVIFTAAAEDYADIVINELDKNNYIAHRLYRKHTIQYNGIYLKDLSKLGRRLEQMCIIDNSKENYSLQYENGLNIISFIGDQNDNELLFMAKDLMKIIYNSSDDIRPILISIRESMEKRYCLNGKE